MKKTKQPSYPEIKLFLIQNADPIQQEATILHKKHLGRKSLRVENIEKYQVHHRQAVREIGEHLEDEDPTKGVTFFSTFGEQIGRESVQDGLTIEEAIDGTI